MAKDKPGKRHRLQDAAKPLEDYERLARKRLGLPPPEEPAKLPRHRFWPPLFLLVIAVACLVGLGFHLLRSQPAVPPQPRLLSVSFLDVGQGDSTLIRTPSGKDILIDTGPPSQRAALFDELRLHGVTRLEMLVTSHPDQDHYGNTLAVLRSIPTATVVDSGFLKRSGTQRDLQAEIRRQSIPFANVSQQQLSGSRDLGDGVTLSYLAPRILFPDANNNSVVLKISLGKTSFLFMGDAGRDERAWLLASGQDVQATVLKVAHHGSSNGIDEAFLTRVHPEVAVISTGLGNNYGHPHQNVLTALQAAKVQIWRTDLQGTITVMTDGRKYTVSQPAK